MPAPLNPGQQLIDGSLVNQILAQVFSAASGLTAHAGGGITLATKLIAGMNSVDTCVSDADSVQLPVPLANPIFGISLCFVANNTAHSVAVFPPSTKTIDGGAASASVTLTTAQNAVFFCAKDGNWRMIKTA